MVDFVIDESVDTRIGNSIKNNGYSTLFIEQDYRGASDEDIIDIVNEHKAILITEDSDFGEWVFSHGKIMPGVVFLRYHFNKVSEIKQIITTYLLKNNIQDLRGKFITITSKKIRSRALPGSED